MNLVRWDPFREMENFFLGRAGRDPMTASEWAPVVDIAETPEEFVIQVEVPEVKKSDLHVSAQDRVLSIRGERKRASEERGKKFHRIERAHGAFLRSFVLPDSVDESKLSASLEEGILTVRLPKSPKAQPRAIDVKVA